jgi:uncharacterized membrane protein YhfC
MPNLLYLTYPLNGLLMLALAFGTGLWITRRFRLGWRLYWIGAATFVISQVFHIPFNLLVTWLFQRQVLPAPPAEWLLPFNAVFLGLSAGLFEETARFLVLRGWAKEARSWAKGLLFGAGHGGIEAAILGLLVLATYVVMAALHGADLAALAPAGQLELAEQQMQAYWSAPWHLTLLGALERLFTIPVHLALALLVLQVFLRRQLAWLFFAIGWHALLNALAVLISQTRGIYLTEGVLGVMALLSLGMILALRKPEPPEAEPVPPPGPNGLPESDELGEADVTGEALEGTKYVR